MDGPTEPALQYRPVLGDSPSVDRYCLNGCHHGLFIGLIGIYRNRVHATSDEGSILVETRKLPGISLTDSIKISKHVEQTLRAFPEIQNVTTKIGRPNFATEAMGINEGDVYVELSPEKNWTRFHSKEELINAMDKALAQIPGINYDFTQPMAMRLDETVSGVKADLAIKIFGEDFQQLDSLAQQVLRQVNGVRGTADAQMEINSGVAELRVSIRRDALARYAMNVSDVQQVVEAGASGSLVSEVIDGQRRYTIESHQNARRSR